MNYPSVRFVFDRKHVASRTRKGLVQIEILFQRRRKWIGTGIRLFAHQWNDMRHVVNSPTSMEDNETLDTIMENVKQILRGIIKDTGAFSFRLFDDEFKKRNCPKSFLDYVRNTLAISSCSESRKSQYAATFSHLREYSEESNTMRSFDEVSVDSVRGFDEHLTNKNLKGSTIMLYHGIISMVMSKAVSDGFLHENPYDKYTPDHDKSEERCYLSEGELDRFKKVDIRPSQNKYRDFFLVQCYTSLGYSDMLSIDWKEEVEKRDGKLILTGERVKTGVSYYIVLVDPVVEILKKYDYKLPAVKLSTLNNNIRSIAKKAKINKRISNHIGRHTFAVFALSHGVPIEVVAKILGHTDIKTTQVYAKIVDKTVEEKFDMLNELLTTSQDCQ